MEHVLDVSELEPCEPLERTLAASHSLPDGDYLRVIHRREPHVLFPLLEKSGFASHCRQDGAYGYEIFVWREHDLLADRQVKSAI
jgi:hypothetical protein